MAAADDNRRAARDAITKLGEAATYKVGGAGAGTAITALLQKDVQLYPSEASAVISAPKTLVTVLIAEVATPKPNDTVTFGAVVYRVDKIIRNDGYVADLTVKL